MNTQLFIEWGRHTPLLEMRLRRLDHHYDGPILLLVDGFGCHDSDEFTSMCEAEGIVFLPPHTSDQLQPCDLGLFALQKRWSSNIQIDEDLNRQTKEVIRIVDSLRMTVTFKSLTGAFRKAGLITFRLRSLLFFFCFSLRHAVIIFSACPHLYHAPSQPSTSLELRWSPVLYSFLRASLYCTMCSMCSMLIYQIHKIHKYLIMRGK